jgi:hypothetical protein
VPPIAVQEGALPVRFRSVFATAAVALTLTVAGTATAAADSGPEGAAVGSPGVLSGNVIQIPLHVPINLCGNSIDIIALLNSASGNTCVAG